MYWIWINYLSKKLKIIVFAGRSSIYSHVGSSLAGIASIRFMKAEDLVVADFHNYQVHWNWNFDWNSIEELKFCLEYSHIGPLPFNLCREMVRNHTGHLVCHLRYNGDVSESLDSRQYIKTVNVTDYYCIISFQQLKVPVTSAYHCIMHCHFWDWFNGLSGRVQKWKDWYLPCIYLQYISRMNKIEII